MKIVSLDDIPLGNYETPKSNLMHLYAVGQQMENLCISKKGIGLAASQVGIPWNFFVYWDNYPDTPMNFVYMVDCNYEPIGDKFMSIEGCLSLGDKRFQLDRFESVLVKGKRLKSNNDELFLEEFEEEFKGILSVVFQHEIDHSFGRLKMIDVIGKRIYIESN